MTCFWTEHKNSKIFDFRTISVFEVFLQIQGKVFFLLLVLGIGTISVTLDFSLLRNGAESVSRVIVVANTHVLLE